MNAVVIAVIVMLVLSLSRVHVVLSLTVGAFVGGLVAGMPLETSWIPQAMSLSRGLFLCLTKA